MDLPNQGSFDECHCPCHKSGVRMEHIVPCCDECPTCGVNVKSYAYKRHIENCSKDKAAEELKKDLEEKLKELLNKQPHTE